MPAKRDSRNPSRTSQKLHTPLWSRLLLALTLLPLAFGVLLIIAWSFDYILWISPEFQISLASLFILLSFSASNLVQKNWILAAGWVLAAAADWLLLTRYDLPTQILGFFLGAASLFIFAYEIYRRFKQNQGQLQHSTKR